MYKKLKYGIILYLGYMVFVLLVWIIPEGPATIISFKMEAITF